MANSASAIFTYDPGGPGEVQVTVPGPPVATDAELLPRYVLDQTIDSTVWSYTTSTEQKSVWTLTFSGLSASQKSDLHDFYKTTVDGPRLAFRYTHTDGTNYNDCRFLDPAIKFIRTNDRLWDTTLRLLVPSTIS